MIIKVNSSRLSGEITVPGSKSHTIRAFVMGSLANGISKIINPLFSSDTVSCLNGCSVLGAEIETDKLNKTVMIKGFSGKPSPRQDIIDVGNSGTSLRLLSGVASLVTQKIVLDGDDSIRTRPMTPLLSSLNELGATAVSVKRNGSAPVEITGPLKGGYTKIECLCSQYLSSLLTVCPLAIRDTRITVTKLNEKPYVEITLSWLKKLGIQIRHDDMHTFTIPSGQNYHSFESPIPSDFSTACFPLCAAVTTRSKITLKGLDFSDPQGDKKIFEYAKAMGVPMQMSSNEVSIDGTQAQLNGIELDLNSTPDALPVMAVMGCFAKGKTWIRNVAQARIKECDRISAMTKELKKMGAQIEELPDGMIIQESTLKGTRVHGYHDHRIVMALSIAGMACKEDTYIDTAESVPVTYPDFVRDFENLGAKISTEP